MADITPIDYSENVQAPFQAAMQGYQAGAAIRDDQQAQQQRQIALQQQQQQVQVLRGLISNPNATANDYANATLLVPGMKDQLKQAWDTKNTAQQQSAVSDLSQWSAAINNGQPQIAVQAMNNRADAMDAANGGQATPQSQALRTQAQVIDAHPDFGRFMLNATLAAHPDGSKVVDAMAAQGKEGRATAQAPADLVKANADAVDASNKAVVSSATVPALIAKPSIDNAHTEQETAYSQAQQAVNALNTQIAQANSETERGKLVLQRDEWQQKADLLKQTTAAGAQDSLDFTNRSLGTVNALLAHPGFSGFFGAGSTSGKELALIPGTDAHDFRSLLDSLKSQDFLTGINQMKGPNGSVGMRITQTEATQLQNAIANLDPDQSQKQLGGQLGIVKSILERAQSRILATGKAPGTTNSAGGAVVTAHPVFGNVTDAQINRLLQQNPGATRDQVMQFLQQSGQ